jgi:hypothetical protein
MKALALVMAALLQLLIVPAVRSDTGETAKWGKVGGWDIRVDRTVGDGCFAMQVFERGTIVRIGFDVASRAIYLVFGHDDWKSLEEGKRYPVVIRFDNSQDYNGEMKGEQLGKAIFLVHHNLNADFLKDFMARNSMEIFYRGVSIARVSLQNTFAAVAEVIKCQREIGFAGKGPRSQDPVAGTPAGRGADRGADPFK